MNKTLSNFHQQKEILTYMTVGRLYTSINDDHRLWKSVRKIVESNSDKKVKLLNLFQDTDKRELSVELLIKDSKKTVCHLLTLRSTKSKSFLTKKERSSKMILKSELPTKKLKTKNDYFEYRKQKLLDLIGEEAFNGLLDGGSLKVWRNSSPHNYWIESKEGNQLWHRDTEKIFNSIPDQSLFVLSYESSDKVSYYGSLFPGSDLGKPQESCLKLRPEFIKAWRFNKK